MRLVYIYHSGFVVEAEGFSILIDYFKDTNPGPAKGFVRGELLKRPGTLYVLASHFHPDHFNPDVLKWKEEKDDIKYIFSKDILKRRRAKAEDAFYMKKGDVYQDEHLTIRAFGSTDVGISFLIEAQGKLIFHAGDLNNWHWKDESTPQEVAERTGYNSEIYAGDGCCHVSGRSPLRDRFYARCPTIHRPDKDRYLCADAFLGTSGGGHGFCPVCRIERLPVCCPFCTG